MPRNYRYSKTAIKAMPGLRSLPHSVGSVDIQKERVLQRLREKATPLDKYEVRIT